MKYTLISYDVDTIEDHNSDALDDVLSKVQDDHNSRIISLFMKRKPWLWWH